MNAIILSIGDELVLGQTVDTNSAWLSQQLAAVGCGILAHVTVADDQRAIEEAIRDAAERCEVLIVSGGLGPTADDLTREALAAVLGTPLELNEGWVKKLEKFFKQRGRGRPMPERNKAQAMVPRGARMIENTCGTAPGLYAVVRGTVRETNAIRPRTFQPSPGIAKAIPPSPFQGEGLCAVFIVPGVPKEMKAMFERDVLPVIREKSDGAVILSRTLHTFGLGESSIAEMLGDLMDRSRNPSVGTTVSQGIVSLRINARFGSGEEAKHQLMETVARCFAALGDLIFGQNEEALASVVAGQLRLHGVPEGLGRPLTVATAESCTGGLLAKMLTDIPGSSEYFRQGWVTYSNDAKQKLLGVPASLLDEHGAVSEPVVLAMARGARERAGTEFALAISGVAGPTGGTPAKPVGTVCIALAHGEMPGHPADSFARTFNFAGDREMIRDRAAKMALTMLRYLLLGRSMPF